MLQKFFKWLNDSNRWHDLGHVLFGFVAVTCLNVIMPLWMVITVFVIAVVLKELLVDGYSGRDNFKDTLEWLLGGGLAILIMMI